MFVSRYCFAYKIKEDNLNVSITKQQLILVLGKHREIRWMLILIRKVVKLKNNEENVSFWTAMAHDCISRNVSLSNVIIWEKKIWITLNKNLFFVFAVMIRSSNFWYLVIWKKNNGLGINNFPSFQMARYFSSSSKPRWQLQLGPQLQLQHQ